MTDQYNSGDAGYTDGYMEQEEEWEREGLLDPAWEKQQKKVQCVFCCVPLALLLAVCGIWIGNFGQDMRC